jgi:O-antigen ligase
MEPYLGKTPLVVFGSMLLCGLFSKLSTELTPREKKVWQPLSVLIIICVGMTYYFSNTKNGFIVFILIFLAYAFRSFRARNRGKNSNKWVIALIFLALIGFLKVHIDANPAWLNFYADVKAGHDIEHNQNWKNAEKYPLPVNDQGRAANGSTYERSAWATAGAILVQEHPFGYGLINHSFGALALQKWSDFYKPIGKYRHASHSGWLDFTLGFGIPGLALVLLPMWVAFYRAGSQTGFWFEWVRWSVPVVMLVYAITEVCTGHFIEFLFFYIAMVSGIIARKKIP